MPHAMRLHAAIEMSGSKGGLVFVGQVTAQYSIKLRLKMVMIPSMIYGRHVPVRQPVSRGVRADK